MRKDDDDQADERELRRVRTEAAGTQAHLGASTAPMFLGSPRY